MAAAADAMLAGELERACGAGARYERVAALRGADRLARPACRVRRAVARPPERIALTHSMTGGVNLAARRARAGRPATRSSRRTPSIPGLDEPLDELARRRGVVVHRAQVLGAEDPRRRSRRSSASGRGSSPRRTCSGGRARCCRCRGRERRAGQRVPCCSSTARRASARSRSTRSPMGADLYAISGQKWLLGPVGTGALWVREGLEETLAIGPARLPHPRPRAPRGRRSGQARGASTAPRSALPPCSGS